CVLARWRPGAAGRAGADCDRALLLRRSDRECDRRSPARSARLGQELEATRPQPAGDLAWRGGGVGHGEAWTRLPDLVDDREDAALLAHVRACAACQRQLFLLGRVDRLLRDQSARSEATPRSRVLGRNGRALAAAAAAIAAAVAVVFGLLLSQNTRTHDMVLRMGSGIAVGRAAMSHS